eukprot:TRINITY_DN11587_c0_g1_i1.p1 TRINITY_DN11587_c0_g1~~TRINITY_DN11587_c0_g1_i1.p1  ORF type:complete len:1244 (-),score=296.36 TRINITY_DN11587_c0_g1_i1:199-3930(-)
MNITVENADGLPERAFVSIRVADQRKQVQYRPGECLRFDVQKPPRHFVLDVFEKVASKQVSFSDLDVEDTFGDDGSSRKRWGCRAVPLMRRDGKQMSVDLQVGFTSLDGKESAEAAEAKRLSRHQAALQAKKYLDCFAVQTFLQKMVHSLLAEQPADPYKFMSDFLWARDASSTRPPTSEKTAAAGYPEDLKETPPVGEEGLPQASCREANAAEDCGHTAAAAAAAAAVPPKLSPPQAQQEGCDSHLEAAHLASDAGDDSDAETVDLPDFACHFAGRPGLGEEEAFGFPLDEAAELPELSQHCSYCAQFLSSSPGRAAYDRLRQTRTPYGATLAKCIKPGMDVKGHGLVRTFGLVAADEACYEVFEEVFNAIIERWHEGFSSEARHIVDTDAGKLALPDRGAFNGRLLSVSVSGSRNISGYAMPAAISRDERAEVERLLTESFVALQPVFQGKYYPLRGSSSIPVSAPGSRLQPPSGLTRSTTGSDESSLRARHILFSEPESAVHLSAGLGRHWPHGRGIFAGITDDVYLHVNETDHLKIFCQSESGDLRLVFEQFQSTAEKIEQQLQENGKSFSRHDRLGYLTTWPVDLGGMRIALVLHLPVLSQHNELLSELCRANGLSYHLLAATWNSDGDEDDCVIGRCEVALLRRLLVSEVEQANLLAHACLALLAKESQLQAGEGSDGDAVPTGFCNDATEEQEKEEPGTGAAAATEEAEQPAAADLHATSSSQEFQATIKVGFDNSTAITTADLQDTIQVGSLTVTQSYGDTVGQLSGPSNPATADLRCSSLFGSEALVPGLGGEDLPGFSPEVCPAELPDLSRHHSVVADILRTKPSIYEELRDRRTALGTPFARCIKPCMDNPGHPMIKSLGLAAGDAECYTTFAELFEPVMRVKHGPFVDGKDNCHPVDLCAGNLSLGPLDPRGECVVAVRLLASRNLSHLPMPPAATLEQRKEVESLLVDALTSLGCEDRGEYLPLRGSYSVPSKPGGMTAEQEERLAQADLLLQEPDARLLLATGSGRFWPAARGVWAAADSGLAAWVGGEDHLRLLCARSGPDLQGAFERFCAAHGALQDVLHSKQLGFARDQRLGFLNSDVGNVGTALRVEVLTKLPLTSAQPGFYALCRRLGVQALTVACMMPTVVAHGVPFVGSWVLTNTQRLGSSEVDQVQAVANATQLLASIEERLRSGEELSLEAFPEPAKEEDGQQGSAEAEAPAPSASAEAEAEAPAPVPSATAEAAAETSS